MAHTAFRPVLVIENIRIKLECMEVWKPDILLFGMAGKNGVLAAYEEVPDRTGVRYNLMTMHRNFASKKVTQLNVIEDANLLFSICDDYFTVHDLKITYDARKEKRDVQATLRTNLPDTKGAVRFAVDVSSKAVTFAVATKKVIFVYQMANKEFLPVRQLAITEAPRTMVWAGPSLCVGFKKQYSLINVRMGSLSRLIDTGSGNVYASAMPDDQLLVSRDKQSYFLEFSGKPAKQVAILWGDQPRMFGYAFPFVLGVLPKVIEVRAMSTLRLIQPISLQGIELMAIKDDRVFVASSNRVFLLQPVPIMDQIKMFVEENQFQEAIELLGILPESEVNQLQPMMDSKSDMYDDDDAMGAQKKDVDGDAGDDGDAHAVETDPRAALIRDVQVREAFYVFMRGHAGRAMDHFLECRVNPLKVIGLFPNMLPRRYHFDYPYEVPDMIQPVLESGLKALTKYLTAIRPRLPRVVPGATNVSEEDYDQCTHVRVIVDTCLLKAMVKTDSPHVMRFLSNVNNVHVVSSVTMLLGYHRYLELVELYRSKGEHRAALQLLHKLGTEGPVNSMLRGPGHSLKYLMRLGRSHLDLILEFSEWLLESVPEAALQVFTQPRDADEALPPDAVLAHIRKLTQRPVVVMYLEWLLTEQMDETPDFHDQLIFHYLSVTLELMRERVASPSAPESAILRQQRQKLLDFLIKSRFYHPEKMLSRFPLHDLFEERAILLSRIGRHDQALAIYAHKLNDSAAAEAYCGRNYARDGPEEARDVYLSLLRVYLSPPEGKAVMLQPALDLLNKYHSRMNTALALEILPDNLRISDMQTFFHSVLGDDATAVRHNQVVGQLLWYTRVMVREELIKRRAKCVVIEPDSRCAACGTPMSNAVPVVYPDGTVIHVGCNTTEYDDDDDDDL